MQKRILSLFFDGGEFSASSYISYKQKTNRLFFCHSEENLFVLSFYSFKTRDKHKDFLVYRLW